MADKANAPQEKKKNFPVYLFFFLIIECIKLTKDIKDMVVWLRSLGTQGTCPSSLSQIHCPFLTDEEPCSLYGLRPIQSKELLFSQANRASPPC